ncbi:MAG: Holliday junction resolvase RuvX [Gammaproteobacteria bacterium]
MNQALQTLMGFDYGAKRIGVAVGQELTRTATPLETVTVTNAKPDWAAITRLITSWQPGALVVGLPFNEDGSEHDVTRAARRFGQQLQGRYHLPVHTVDERLSSFAAEHMPRPHGASPRHSKQTLDKVAAQVILQAWLERSPHEG